MTISRRLFAAAIFLSSMSAAMPADAQQEMKTASGLRYTDNKVGTGKTATAGKDVEVHYTGWLYLDGLKGKQFDSSRSRGPFAFPPSSQPLITWPA
jgi:FKBP-type peptidyl-prolyl cis-trans isomerase